MRQVQVLTFVVLGASAFIEAPIRAQGYSPAEAPGRMTVADGLEVRLFASEPMIRQPVAIEFDDRGRLWVIQYLQYPNPAGLKRVKVDRYSRTVYDQVPEPPPRGPRGRRPGHDPGGHRRRRPGRPVPRLRGRAEPGQRARVRTRRRVRPPDSLSAVLPRPRPRRPSRRRPRGAALRLRHGRRPLGGQLAHLGAGRLALRPARGAPSRPGSAASSSSRASGAITPGRRRFELFCEGGGNMWGLDFDRHGQLFASTNVGGFVMLHGVQGGYYWKSFGKHGPLHNPYTYGYFDHVRHDGLHGGHVAVGGLFYEADAWPAEWRGRYIAADLLGHAVHWHEVTPLGSTFRARQAADVLRANDTWFAPSDLTLGPDGALYVADWHDRRTAHPDPDADWDRSNGRIYRIAAKGAKPAAARDLAASSNQELVALLNHPNVWYRRKARRLLERASVGWRCRYAPPRRARRPRPACARSLLDALRLRRPRRVPCAALARAPRLRMSAPGPSGSWGTSRRSLIARSSAILELAGREPEATVRSQLACTARRLSPAAGSRCRPAAAPSRPRRERSAHPPLALVGRRAPCAGRRRRNPGPVRDARSLEVRPAPVDDPAPPGPPIRRGTEPVCG